MCARRCPVYAAPLPACAAGFGEAGCGSHALTAMANPAQPGKAHLCTCALVSLQGPASESLERLTVGMHPQQVHRAANSSFPSSLFLLSLEGLVGWGKCGEEQIHKDTFF